MFVKSPITFKIYFKCVFVFFIKLIIPSNSGRMMMPWLQIYDNDKYGRWLQEFWLATSDLPGDKAQCLHDGLFVQSMTGRPYSCLPLDLWIEMTMNKGSKMKAGWLKILKNKKMLLTTTRNVH